MTTLRMTLSGKQDYGTDEKDDRQSSLSFTCDYMDGRNKEWSRYTPSASLTMTVKGHIADEFNLGDKVEVIVVTRKEEEEVKDVGDSPA
jgi:hypothetical protein